MLELNCPKNEANLKRIPCLRTIKIVGTNKEVGKICLYTEEGIKFTTNYLEGNYSQSYDNINTHTEIHKRLKENFPRGEVFYIPYKEQYTREEKAILYIPLELMGEWEERTHSYPTHGGYCTETQHYIVFENGIKIFEKFTRTEVDYEQIKEDMIEELESYTPATKENLKKFAEQLLRIL